MANDFDPDAYLAKYGNSSSSGGGSTSSSSGTPSFDPEAYIAKYASTSQTGIPNQGPSSTAQMMQKFPTPTDTGTPGEKLRTASENALDSLGGYAPNIIGGIKSVGSDESYPQLRDEERTKLNQLNAQNPNYALGGKAAGLVGTLALPLGDAFEGLQAAKNAGLLGKLGMGLVRGGVAGGALGALQNPGDTAGQVDGLQLGQRAKNALTGAEIGAPLGTATEGLLNLPQIGENMQSGAEKASFNALRPTLKDVNQLTNDPFALDDKMRQIGRTALDEGIVTGAPKKSLTLAQDAETARLAKGQEFGNYIQQIDDALKGKTESMTGKELAATPPPKVGVDLGRIADDLEENLSAKSTHPSAKGRNDSVSDFADSLRNNPDQILDVKSAQAMKQDADELAGWGKPTGSLSLEEKMNRHLSTSLKDGITNSADGAVDYLKADLPPDFTDKFQQVKQDYGNLKQIGNTTVRRAKRDIVNRATSLSDNLQGIGGGGIAAAAGANPLTAAGVAAIDTLGNKVVRTFGNQALAGGLDKAGGLLQSAQLPDAMQGLLQSRPDLLPNAVLQSQKNQGLLK